ncbi:MAG: hypothetical protein ABIK54_07105 [candidate division WOR-3 bacterium]
MHYYLYEFGTAEGDTGACIVEIYSDSAQSPGPEFTKVTLDQLHSLGYLTYQEQVALTPHYNIDLVSYVNGFIAASWAETIPPPPNRPQTKKYTWCGSKTLRPYSGPWYLYCRYQIDGRIIGVYNLGSQHGDGDVVQWILGVRRGNPQLHEVDGGHAFEYPPGNAIIPTRAVLYDPR